MAALILTGRYAEDKVDATSPLPPVLRVLTVNGAPIELIEAYKFVDI